MEEFSKLCKAEEEAIAAEVGKKNALENEKLLEATVRREGEFVYFGAYPQRLYKGMRAVGIKPQDEQGYFLYLGSSSIKRCAFLGEGQYRMPYIVEPIKWRILSEDYETLYLMSTKALDAQIFSTTNNNYKESNIRAWLNDVFLNKAFTPAAQKKICKINCKIV